MKYGRGMPRPIAKDRTFHRIRYFCFGSRHAATVQHQEQQEEQHQKQEEQQERRRAATSTARTATQTRSTWLTPPHGATEPDNHPIHPEQE